MSDNEDDLGLCSSMSGNDDFLLPDGDPEKMVFIDKWKQGIREEEK